MKKAPRLITPGLLNGWPLPLPDAGGDKEERGRVLVIGGAAEMPGAVMLAATAALRAGAGKLQIATSASVAPLVAAATPEARVFALKETKAGGLALSAVDLLRQHMNEVQALLIGPGLVDTTAVLRLLEALLPLVQGPTLILDAAALEILQRHPRSLSHLHGQAILTPHAGEMAKMLGLTKREIMQDPLGIARRAAADLRATVALKGAETFIADHLGHVYCNRAGNVGLATSGSGDTLSGVIAGLAARGAVPVQAAAWGVYLHARAGERLAGRVGPLGYLARELLAEVPAVMARLAKGPTRRRSA